MGKGIRKRWQGKLHFNVQGVIQAIVRASHTSLGLTQNRVNKANQFTPDRVHVNTARVTSPVLTNQTSQGKMGTAVKTSAGCVWRKTSPLSITNSGPIPDSYVHDHPLKHMEHRGIFDSGCSGHMTGNRAHLEDYQELSKVGSVTFGGSKGSISGKGTIRLGNLVFDDVAFVKELGHFNLFSISQICDKKLNVLFTEKECFVVSSDFKMPDENQVLLKVPRQHNMYTFDMKNVDSSKGYTCLLAKASSNEAKLWHRRKELDSLALKALKGPVNTGNMKAVSPSAQNEDEVFSDDNEDEMPEIRIYDKSSEGIFEQASYDDEGVITDIQTISLMRAWYATLSTFLEKHGYKRGTIDKTLFIRRNKKDIMLVQVYVDDIIFGSTNKSWCDEFEALMQSRFQMSSMGELTFFLGLQVKQNKEGIFISQDKYVAEILKKFDLVHVKAAITPMETKLPLTKDEEAFDVDVHLYRSMIGSLMYLTASRPDIMYAVCVCSRFQVTPKTSHLNAVKRIFKYLKGKPNLGLWYPRESPLDLEAFSDSDYGGSNLDRKSTTGGCQFLGQRLISWQCKKQTIIATSTTEAEYVAAANCCGQVLWVQNQLLDYGFNFMNTKIHIDNESTICIVKNPVYHSKTKHIEIRHHFIRDCYEKKLISVEKIHTDLNVADLLTKPFDGPRFNYLVVSIGFAEIVDFLRGSNLRYALTANPTIYDSLVKQFWQSAVASTREDGSLEISATVDTTIDTIREWAK
ncbi:putative ribonuclease H-like domain-containing protein [Tanacetum coccineum]|uniref:Ribonuclease H-like domain-containing protein n=1 Tax=Tanacetum coccineum TaxID=301880 RepID=A0ABQ5GFH4_9ASTR